MNSSQDKGMIDRLSGAYKKRFHGRHRAMRAAEAYVARQPTLQAVLERIEQSSSAAIGLSLRDYAALYARVRQLKPDVVLECGTGKSTWVMAQAMLDNQREGQARQPQRLISMEQDQAWYDMAVHHLPEAYQELVQVVLSPVELASYAFFQGTAYRDVPDLAYQFVFIDGPKAEFEGRGNYCNMDFVRLVSRSETPIHGFIDFRKNTVLAYSLIFGPDKVTFHHYWGYSTIAPVSRHDLVIDDQRKWDLLWPRLVQIRRDRGLPA